MTNKNNANTNQYIIVAAICAAIGFGAIYAVSGGGNSSKKVESATFNPSARLENLGQNNVPSTGNTAQTGAGKALLTGPNGEKLNKGDMVTFVFKDAPMPVAEFAFNGPDGKPTNLKNWKNRVVLLNLWATWCAPCRKEMPYLNALEKELGSDNFEVVALSIDRGSPEKSRQFLNEVNAANLKLYHDPTAKVGTQLKAIGMPATLLIDGQGREIGRLVGPAEWHSEDAKALIRAAIKANEAQKKS